MKIIATHIREYEELRAQRIEQGKCIFMSIVIGIGVAFGIIVPSIVQAYTRNEEIHFVVSPSWGSKDIQMWRFFHNPSCEVGYNEWCNGTQWKEEGAA